MWYYTILCSNISFDSTFYISDIISGLTIMSAVIAGIFALIKWNMNLKLKRAEYLKTLLDEMKKNETIYMFDYGSSWYDEEFRESEIEKEIDSFFHLMSYICFLIRRKILKSTEYNCFKYDLDRVLGDTQTISYFYNLYHFSKRLNQPIPFYDLFMYAKENEYLDEEFWNIKSDKYPHYLI